MALPNIHSYITRYIGVYLLHQAVIADDIAYLIEALQAITGSTSIEELTDAMIALRELIDNVANLQAESLWLQVIGSCLSIS